MGKGVEKVRDFMKKEAVLCIALGLAILSAFWQPVDKNYLGYIDWNTLMLLFCLLKYAKPLKSGHGSHKTEQKH